MDSTNKPKDGNSQVKTDAEKRKEVIEKNRDKQKSLNDKTEILK